MTKSCLFASLLAGTAALLLFSANCAAEQKEQTPRAAQVQFFEEEVQPILKKHCFTCHSGSKPKANLRLDYRGGLLKGGESGSAVSLETPGESLLLEAINYESYQMPPKGQLPQKEIDILTRWVKQGLAWTPGKDEPPADEESAAGGPPQINDETRSHWAFRPVEQPQIPEVNNRDWVKTPVDAFILSRLETESLQPAPRASKVALIRRAFYNLTGLPPAPDQVQAFLADDSPDAWETLIDRLLESPYYGEKWARHWLDLVRYAETNSYERDGAKPFVWRYRDYVIRSFNDDKPYNQFIREQLAGDELDNPTPESFIATGYYRLGIWDDEPADPEQAYYDDLDDILSTTGQAFLGLTIGCARCHDHKLDPIPQKDYYSMLAFFTNIRRYGVRAHETVLDASVRMVGPEQKLREYEQELEQWRAELKKTEAQLRAIDRIIKPSLNGGEVDDFKHESARVDLARKRVPDVISRADFERYVELTKKRDRLRKSEPEGLMQVLCVKEHGPRPHPTHVLIRGNAHAEGDKVRPAFPEVLGFPAPEFREVSPDAASSGRRRVLADWVADPDNPLTARVMVNRIWQHHFGRGIVRSPNDFGLNGMPPTHPELLDWLAGEFIAGGWKLKRIHKLLMLSSAWQMASQADDRTEDKDPQNDYFSRQNMRRLTAEEIRDSILAVNGSLNRSKMYGPSVYIEIPPAVLAGQSRPGAGWGKSPPREAARRSIYIHVKRSLLVPILSSFDFPVPDFTCPERFVTTQPTQALGMLNSDFINKQAVIFADKLKKQAGDDPAVQVKTALRRVMQRESRQHEIDRGVQLIEQMKKEYNIDDEEALEQFCLVALNLNEFFYLD